MNPRFLEECIQSGMSVRQIAAQVGKSQNSVRYWLAKFGMKTKHKSFKQIGKTDYKGKKRCPRCKKEKPISEFHQRRGKIGGAVYCKSCTSQQSLERQRGLKQKAIDYKGGKCEECGYNKCNAALEFHHKNPKEKDFHLGTLKSYSFTDKIKKELDKCILVCSNCHREIHYLLP